MDYFSWQNRQHRRRETVTIEVLVPQLWPEKPMQVEERQLSETGVRKFWLKLMGKP